MITFRNSVWNRYGGVLRLRSDLVFRFDTPSSTWDLREMECDPHTVYEIRTCGMSSTGMNDQGVRQ